jgi:hypothetical protein
VRRSRGGDIHSAGVSGVGAGQTQPARGRVICSTVGPTSRARPMMAKAAPTALSSAR